MRTSVHDAMVDIRRDEWNRLAGSCPPFLRHEFLQAAETTGCVAESTGWRPCHLTISDDDGRLRAALPLYEKYHSWGEFVFDWAWADAYARAGLDYYPKLVSAVPFTPATSPRLLLADRSDTAAAKALLDGALEMARDRNCSSLHILFPDQAEIATLESSGFKIRKDCQFHWRNRGYADFEEFLGTFSSSKRKKARRDRRRVAEAGIRFRRLTGHELTAELLDTTYRLISRTFLMRGSMPYYNQSFFEELSTALPDQLLVLLAEDDSGPVAASVFFVSADALYGRYWGSEGDYNALHFEACYYQGIDYCIEHGLSLFEPGTQGEHKVSRGFTPAETRSAHWLAHPQFLSAIGEYVEEEARHVDRYMQSVESRSPYRRDD